MKEFDFKEVEAPTELIGKGSHGSVYKATLKDGNQVAIKKQSLGLQKLRDNSKLENEARILSTLAQDASLIGLLGTSRDEFGNKVLVMEYMPNGTLHEVLHASAKPPPWPRRVQTALQVAQGIRLLHESNPTIVHRDIKSCNVLFDGNWNAKLADFGLAVMLSSDKELNLPAGTMGYLDPEYVTPSKLSTKIDVFSYGVVLLELISGRKAIDVNQSPSSIVDWAVPLIKRGETRKVLDKRLRMPHYMEGNIKLLLNIAARCVSSKENIRPLMDEVVRKLENLSIEPVRLHFSMLNCFRGMVLNFRRLRLVVARSELSKSGGACGEEDRRNSRVGGDRTLLVREILADLALK